jgi:CRP-like cAMP-binding protein
LRIEIAALENELTQNEGLRLILDVYAQAVYVQTAHIAACNGWHDLQSRFARWLLLARDRADSDDLPLTQEFLAMMLCVHRPRITVIAGILQTAGIITYNRGHIIIRNREALEATACECYGIMREQFEQVFRHDRVRKRTDEAV